MVVVVHLADLIFEPFNGGSSEVRQSIFSVLIFQDLFIVRLIFF